MPTCATYTYSRYDGVIQYYYLITLYCGTENSIALFGNRAILLLPVRPSSCTTYLLYNILSLLSLYVIYSITHFYCYDIRHSSFGPRKRQPYLSVHIKKINKYPAASVCCRFPRSQRTHISLKINVTGQIEFSAVTYDRRTTRFSRFPPICMCAHR